MKEILKECLKRNEKDARPMPISSANEYRELIVLGYLEAKEFIVNHKVYTGYSVSKKGIDFLSAQK